MSIKKIIKSKSFAVIVCILIVAAIIVMFPEMKAQYIKRFGIEIVPETDVEPLYTQVYMQIDERWKDENLAQTDYTLEEQGCLTCVIAMDLCYYDYDVLPTDINNEFIKADAYTDDGLLIWYKINDAYKNIEYEYAKVFSGKIIDEALQNGLLPIVKVKYKKTGVFHWVLIVGAQDGDYLVLDPLDKTNVPIALSTHGKVYAYRVLKKTE